MAKSDKKVKGNKKNSLVKEFGKTIDATRKELQKQVKVLNRQFKELRKEVKQPALKLIDSIEDRYQQQLKKMQHEFEARLDALHGAQERLISHLPEELTKHLPFATPQTTQQKVKAKVASTQKNLSKGARSVLAQVKGIGPALEQKLSSSGITSLEALANPDEIQAKALEAFKTIRSFDTWKKQAEELLAKKG